VAFHSSRPPIEYKVAKFGDRALVLERGDSVLFNPVSPISEERGSLRQMFEGETAVSILKDAREADAKREEELESIK
jgi:hypothetical protein